MNWINSRALDRIQPFQIRVEGITASSQVIQPPPKYTSVTAGQWLHAQVLTFNDEVVKCHLQTNEGTTVEFKPNDESSEKFQLQPDNDLSQCAVSIHLEIGDVGMWTLTSEDIDGRSRVQRYNVSIDIPDSSDKNERTVYYLDDKLITTTIDSNHIITIPDQDFGETTSCEIVGPDGIRNNVDALENTEVIAKDLSSACSVAIKVTTYAVGKWKLISKGDRFSVEIERILPFRIVVEKTVQPAAEVLDVREGMNMYITLRNSVPEQYRNTCKLLAPNGFAPSHYSRIFQETCGYKVLNVTTEHSGDWEISYGDVIKYRAIVRVNVHAVQNPNTIDLAWVIDRPTSVTIGPADAVYCRVRNPQGFEVYNGFGRCVMNVGRVSRSEHQGLWRLDVGMPGQVLTQEYVVNVIVRDAPNKPPVNTSVTVDPNDKHIITLSCGLASPSPVQTCKFRDPKGRILIATEGVGESRYSWHGTGVNYTSGLHQHDCGIRIVNATNSDVGIWRCAMDTDGDTYFGFLTVKGPWIRDPEIAAMYPTKPFLVADRFAVSGMEGDSVTMTCSIRAPIRYCYFRARNGTVFNVAPTNTHDVATYVGAGFDAGECGIRFLSLATSDSGYWSCHVGLLDLAAPEQRARLDVTIFDAMAVNQFLDRRENRLELEANVHNSRPLEYCRFVRIDGFGFTHENVPPGILDRSDLSIGYCSISIISPTNVEQHPWVIVAKVKGQEGEVSRVTDIAFTIPNPPGGGGGGGGVQFRVPGAWIIVMSIGMCMILLASFIGPKKNREWTYARASAIRNSFTKKKVEENANDPSKNTAVAA
ncbi:uncharacterized protein LOC112055455 isoform X2 [Bicyclus anynana]|uniref:Uncharacterized protein LOC112055455 isoform X2 n=1 Tax=Bicyclus anynana TaxID=110368 RepID=A0A6J1NUG8_BICAN|nr:uncharacterized protein LOC112055455 isoform X2 [Bicyclus anynana]